MDQVFTIMSVAAVIIVAIGVWVSSSRMLKIQKSVDDIKRTVTAQTEQLERVVGRRRGDVPGPDRGDLPGPHAGGRREGDQPGAHVAGGRRAYEQPDFGKKKPPQDAGGPGGIRIEEVPK